MSGTRVYLILTLKQPTRGRPTRCSWRGGAGVCLAERRERLGRLRPVDRDVARALHVAAVDLDVARDEQAGASFAPRAVEGAERVGRLPRRHTSYERARARRRRAGRDNGQTETVRPRTEPSASKTGRPVRPPRWRSENGRDPRAPRRRTRLSSSASPSVIAALHSRFGSTAPHGSVSGWASASDAFDMVRQRSGSSKRKVRNS